MSERLHPATKALRAMSRTGDSLTQERTLLRRVKPLLDALEGNHKPIAESRNHPATCPDCRLLAAWKEPLK